LGYSKLAETPKNTSVLQNEFIYFSSPEECRRVNIVQVVKMERAPDVVNRPTVGLRSIPCPASLTVEGHRPNPKAAFDLHVSIEVNPVSSSGSGLPSASERSESLL
jgi:hypothetical protein